MTIHGCPGELRLGQSYKMDAKITNYNNRPTGVRIDWHEDESQGIFACELSRRVFPKLEYEESVEFPCCLCASCLACIVWAVSRLRIWNDVVEKLASVFVHIEYQFTLSSIATVTVAWYGCSPC